jgi:signal peptidase I
MQDGLNKTGATYWLRVLALGRKPTQTLVRIVVLVVLSTVVFKCVLRPVRVTGASMEPTCHDGAIKFVNRVAYFRQEPQRGDVVAIRMSRTGLSVMYMKRIVGMPGDTVAFHRGRLVVNNQEIPEPYVVLSYPWNRAPITVGPDEYFVVGDNRAMEIEDHVFGVAEKWRLVGKVIL